MKYDFTRKRSLSVSKQTKLKDRGFTLIELLVVIAIIALLLGILMPSLGKIKDKARAVICKTRLKGCHDVMKLFTNDNDDRFPEGDWDGDGNGDQWGQWWIQPMQSYNPDPDLLICPKANRKPNMHRRSFRISKDSITQWGSRVLDGTSPKSFGKLTCGSLASNGWIMSTQRGVFHEGTMYPGYQKTEPEYFWQKFPINRASQVPLFLDSCWAQARPMDLDLASRDESEKSNFMHCFAINRHNGFVNSAFCDGSVRKVGLKGLWRLKWNREFNTNNAQANAAPEDWFWMKNFTDEH